MAFTIIVSKDVSISNILENGSVVDDKYYYLPFWFEKTNNGNFKMHHLNDIPKELKEQIELLINKNNK